MNIYDMLRFFVRTLASLGPVNKEDAYNAVDLVNQLQRMSAFGEIGRITTGAHMFTPNNHYRFPFEKCNICGKAETEHE